MTKIIDYGRFAERLAADRPRWALLDEVQREWGYRDPGGDPLASREDEAPGYEPDEPVPAALLEWWDSPFNSFAMRPRLYWTHPQWPPSAPDSVDDPPGDSVRVIMAEYQWVNQWGYLASEAAQDDPKVVVNTAGGWTTQSRSISEFFLQLALERLPAHFGWSIRVPRKTVDDDPAIVARLQDNYRDMGLLPWQEMGTDALSYGAPDAIIRHGRGPGADYAIVVQARTRRALTDVLDTLGLTWSDEDVAAPAEVPPRTEDLGPASFAGDDERWTAAAVPAASAVPALPDVAALRDLPERTAAGTDRDRTAAAAGTSAGHVHVWDAAGAEIGAERLHRAPVTAVACVRDAEGLTVVSGDANGVLRRWKPGVGVFARAFAHRDAPVTALAGATLETGAAVAAAWADGLVRIWDLATGSVADLRIGTGIEALGLRPEGVLHVTATGGSAALRLDLDRLWPDRDYRSRIDRIAWKDLWSNHGPAVEVPGLLGTLASDDEDAAQAAVKRLYELLVSRHGPNAAAAPAVPFLVERMLVPGNRARNTLLLLIADIADGPGDEREAVKAAVPSLRHLLDDDHPSIRWAANELVRICEA